MSTSKQNPTIVTGIGRSPRKGSTASLAPPHEDLFDTLATEIIQDIFIYACPNVSLPIEFDSRMSPAPVSTVRYPLNYVDPMMLAMVCKRWHAITITHRSLWATISIEASRISPNEWERWGFLQLRDRLERSCSHPLKISINLTTDDDYQRLISGILDLVIPHSERWAGVEFVGFSLTEFDANFASFSAPSLKRLGLWDTDIQDLRNIRVTWKEMIDIRNIQIPWEHITDITLRNSSIYQERNWHEALSGLSVSLIALTFLDYAQSSGENRRPPITLPKLQRLRFSDACHGILDMLICPLLEQLEIGQGEYEIPNIKQFLDNSSCSLTHIHIGGIDQMDGFDDIFQHSSLSGIKSISLDEIPEVVLGFFVLDTRNFFPSLETVLLDLSWNDLGNKPEFINRSIEGLTQILNSRTYGARVIVHELCPRNGPLNFIRSYAPSSPKKFFAHVFRHPSADPMNSVNTPYMIYGV